MFSPIPSLLATCSFLALVIHHSTSTPTLTLRQSKPSGLSIVPNTCTAQDEASLQQAIFLLPLIATAGVNAAKQWTEAPFNYFFDDHPNSAEKVATIFNHAADAAHGKGPSVGVACMDPLKRCQTGGLMGYQYNDMILFCPMGLPLPSIQTPCVNPPGVINIVGQLLHELLHVQAVTRTDHRLTDINLLMPSVRDSKARQVKALLDIGFDTTSITTSYAFVASWAWELGLGELPEGMPSQWDGKSCLGNFEEGDFDAPRWIVASEEDIAGDQRRLLYGV